ncbi:superoxide dismutase family protein [Pseudonocardia sp. ICBG1293]|uniref:superoxide dismutase family protein n=1 Tax=Pseudonocardia sp. ICBG1293 TaxID=2844382 RepID=UPI001CC92E40|nr:superoxide dismutase family protein [Pseudonocardia sp. ICBG1293]
MPGSGLLGPARAAIIIAVIHTRSLASASLLAATALVLTACGGGQPPASPAAGTEVTATVARGGEGPAFTYDPTLVPAGATVTVTSAEQDGSTVTTLRVSGLVPNRTYGAHAHTQPCTAAAGADAGPHYQFSEDPVTPSVDPSYANPMNEIWLDVTTDANGAGESTSTDPWVFPDDRRAESVVLHEEPTATHAGHAGTAGGRPGCTTVDF